MSSDQPETFTKDEILLAFDSAMASLMTARLLLDRIIPDGAGFIVPEQGKCAHVNRAPSDPDFCLDCETEVGVSSGFSGGDES